jgi:signal transduction histidine kinase
MKTVWDSFVTSGLNLPRDDSRYRKVYLINTLSLLVISALIFYIIFNLTVTGLYVLAFVEAAVLVVATIPIFILRKVQNVELAATIVTINLFILLIFFIYDQKHHDYALAQAVFLPVLAIFLKGKRFGLIYALSFIAIVLFIAYGGIDVWEPVPFTFTSFVNLISTYLFVIIMIYYFENSRKEAFGFLKKAREREYQNNLKLHEKTILLNHANEELRDYKIDLEKKVDSMLEAKRAQDHILIQQSKMAAMGEMMSAITHQWKQPLTTTAAIVGNIKLEEEFKEKPNSHILTNMDKIQDQLNFMNQTINDFSNFFKPQKTKEIFVLSNTCMSVVKLIESQLQAKSIKLSTHFEDETLSITNYKNEFIQVLLNIINNAKDALESKIALHSIQKGEGSIKLSTFTKGDYIYITIEDNAQGIPESIIDKIFDPYFTTKSESMGTGIGLYMSKSIVEESMGGSLKVTNGEHGAIFTIKL